MVKGKALLAKVRKALASKRGGAYKRKTTSLVKRNITNNPKDWFAGRSKIFGPMPASMGVRQTFQSDPRYDPTNVSGMSQTAGLVYQSYQFLLLTDMSLRTKKDVVNPNLDAYWHNTSHFDLCGIYQEFEYEMTYIRGSFILDSLAVNTATPAVTTVQVALGVVPLTWLRKDSGVQHASTDHATFFSGVDYYAMMTGMPGTKNLLLTADGSSGLQTFNFKVDPFKHVGFNIRGDSQVTNASSGPNIQDQSTRITYPGSLMADQQVLLIAYRWAKASDSNNWDIRASLTCDQHFTYRNQMPSTQYLNYVYTGATPEFPDNR